MTPQEALNNLAAAARMYRGTADEHEVLVRAIQTLLPLVTPKPEPADPAPVEPA